MGADLSAYLWPEGQIPNGAQLRPEYFDVGALCFVFDSTEPINLARNNYGKKPVRVAAALKIRAPGVGVGCSSTTRSYLDATWDRPIATSDGVGTGAFAVLFSATLARWAARSQPFHVRYNAGPSYNSFLIVQNGYYADGAQSGTTAPGTLWIGTFESEKGNARGFSLIDELSASQKSIILLYNRHADGTSDLWVNGVCRASRSYVDTNNITSTAQHLSIGGNAVADGFASSDPIHLLYAANKAFSKEESAALSANSSMLFMPNAIPFPVLESSAGPTASIDITAEASTFSGSASVSPVASLTVTTEPAAFSGSAQLSPIASLAVTTDASVFSGIASAGATCSLTVTTEPATFSGSAAVSPSASLNLTTEAATFAGIASAGASASMNVVTAAATFSGSAAVSPFTTLDITTAGASFSGVAHVSPIASLAITTIAAVFSGEASVSGATCSLDITTEAATFSGASQVSPIAALSIATIAAVFSGSTSGGVPDQPALYTAGILRTVDFGCNIRRNVNYRADYA